MSIRRVLVANRGEIAVRILKTLKTNNLHSLLIYASSDADSLATTLADTPLLLPGTTVAETYLNAPMILQLAKSQKADAVIPGYGFLAEDAEFAESVEEAGIKWVGPTPGQMRRLGRKMEAREEMEAAGVPVVPGSRGVLGGVEEGVAAAEEIGWPVMLKGVAGGGGIGMRRCNDEGELRGCWGEVKKVLRETFGNDGVFVERMVAEARHVEVQIVGDGRGGVVAVGERDCSVQRRHQKVIEETPAARLLGEVRRGLFEAAVRMGERVRYRGVGTVEFLVEDGGAGDFYFLEVNTRLQAEHGITELVNGIDLVKIMLEVAEGSFDLKKFRETLEPRGVAIEARICAESPFHDFIASPGTIMDLRLPEGPGIRVDTGIQKGSETTSLYDSLIVKIAAHGMSRAEAIVRLRKALLQTRITGIATNVNYVRSILSSPAYKSAIMTTTTLSVHPFEPHVIEFLSTPFEITIQDLPGRPHLWPAGIPPSGPMDDLSLRFANRLVGNAPGMAALECTTHGPTVRLYCPMVLAVTGGSAKVTVNGIEVPERTAFQVGKGDIMSVGAVTQGARVYIAVRGGINVPKVFGSRATFLLGGFGGHNGRQLVVGDTLPVTPSRLESRLITTIPPRIPIPPGPERTWTIGAIPSPHAWPVHFSFQTYQLFFNTTWHVTHNISRLGIRLTGLIPSWDGRVGGEGGLHPSNVHDCPYPVGGVSFTGDESIILTRDGPSLGGFVVWCVVVEGELWKLGQICAGDGVRFVPVDEEEAARIKEEVDAAVDVGTGLAEVGQVVGVVLRESKGVEIGRWKGLEREVSVLTCGERAVIMDFTGGAEETVQFSMVTPFCIYSFLRYHQRNPLPGVRYLAPGVNTIQVSLDPDTIPREFLRALSTISEIPLEVEMPSREISLPLLFNDPVINASIHAYATTIRPSAPWVPSNISFIEHLNGLPPATLQNIIHRATYLVLGLGDVYLGSPCAVPIDPRDRLFGAKYTPARISTPRGAVGLGGMYLCIYAGNSPGGYQLVGRTCDIWDASKIPYEYEEDSEYMLGIENEEVMEKKEVERFMSGETADVIRGVDILGDSNDTPWLFRPFDRISFYPVTSPASLTHQAIKISPGIFSLSIYQSMVAPDLDTIRADIHRRRIIALQSPLTKSLLAPFTRQSIVTTTPDVSVYAGDPGAVERARREWREVTTRRLVERFGEDNTEVVVTPCSGCCLGMVEEGMMVTRGQRMVEVEVMKMRVGVVSGKGGMVVGVLVREGEMVRQGDVVVVVNTGRESIV